MPEYFRELPIIAYDMKGDGNTKLVNNILLRIAPRDNIASDISFFDEHDVSDSETPEMVADKVYGDTEFHWTILILNNIINPFFDWPLNQQELVRFVTSKYDDINAVHHYEDNNGFVVNSDAAFATAITNFLHEETLNEAKRKIKILKPELLGQFVDEYKQLIKTTF